jgi:hypothetical protein
MPAPFETLWTKKFLNKVKRKFQKKEYLFLCNASEEFKELWDARAGTGYGQSFLYREEIRSRARVHFLDMVGFGDCLFKCIQGDDYRTIRLNFLNHEIKRLSEKK